MGSYPNGTSVRNPVILFELRRGGLGLSIAVFSMEFQRAVVHRLARGCGDGARTAIGWAARVRISQARALR